MPNPGKIVSLHSNDVVFLAWQYQEAIPGCLGFSVRRKDLGKAGSDFQPLPAWVGWQGGSNRLLAINRHIGGNPGRTASSG